MTARRKERDVATKPTRKRRSPEETRELILDAAEGLFVEKGPDAYSVQDIARAAGVSRPLVLHYFAQYEEIVEAVLRRRNAALASRVLSKLLATEGALDAQTVLRSLLEALATPVHAKLLAWAALSGRAGRLAVVKNAGLSRIIDAVELRVGREASDRNREVPTRASLERALLVASAAVIGFATCRTILLPAFGRTDDEEGSDHFERALREVALSSLFDAPKR